LTKYSEISEVQADEKLMLLPEDFDAYVDSLQDGEDIDNLAWLEVLRIILDSETFDSLVTTLSSIFARRVVWQYENGWALTLANGYLYLCDLKSGYNEDPKCIDLKDWDWEKSSHSWKYYKHDLGTDKILALSNKLVDLNGEMSLILPWGILVEKVTEMELEELEENDEEYGPGLKKFLGLIFEDLVEIPPIWNKLEITDSVSSLPRYCSYNRLLSTAKELIKQGWIILLEETDNISNNMKLDTLRVGDYTGSPFLMVAEKTHKKDFLPSGAISYAQHIIDKEDNAHIVKVATKYGLEVSSEKDGWVHFQ
jgi:hypothetical protein